MVQSCSDGQGYCFNTSVPCWRSLRCPPQPAAQPVLLWPPFLVAGEESKLNLLLEIKFQTSSFSTPMSETSCIGVLGSRPESLTEAIPALTSFVSDDRQFASAASYQFLEDAVLSTAATERDMTKSVVSRDERLKIASAAPAAAIAANRATEAELPNSSPYPYEALPTVGASLSGSNDDEGVQRVLTPLSPCESVSPFAGVALPPAGPSSQEGPRYSDASDFLAHDVQPPFEPPPPPQQQQQQQLIWPTYQRRAQEQLPRLWQREVFELHPPFAIIDGQQQLPTPPTPPTPGPCSANNATGTALGQHHTITQAEGCGAHGRQTWQKLLAGSGDGVDSGSLMQICASPFLSAAYAPWRPPTPPTPGKGKETVASDTKFTEATVATMATGAEGDPAATPAGPSDDQTVSSQEIRGAQWPGVCLPEAAIPQTATTEAEQPPPLLSPQPVLPRSSASTSATFWHSRRDNCIPVCPISPRSYSLKGVLPARSASATDVMALDPTRCGTWECTPTPVAPYVAAAVATTEGEAVTMEAEVLASKEAQRPKADLLRLRLVVEQRDRHAIGGCRVVVSQETVLPVPVGDASLTSQPSECGSVAAAVISINVPALELPGVLYLRLMPWDDASRPEAGSSKLPSVPPPPGADVTVPPKSMEADGLTQLPVMSEQQTLESALLNEATRRNMTQAASLAPLLSLPVLALPPHVVPELGVLFVESIQEGLPGAPPQRLRQLEALSPGGGTASDGDASVDADASIALLHCAQHQQCQHPYIHGDEYGVDRAAGDRALRSAASSPTRNSTPLMGIGMEMQALPSFPYCTEPVVCEVANQLRTLLTSQELRNRWPLPRELAAAAAWVFQEHFMPLLNDLAAVLSYEDPGLNRGEAAAAAAADGSAMDIVDTFGRLFGFLDSFGNKEQLLSFLACEATQVLHACVSVAEAQTAAATVPSLAAPDKAHTGHAELQAAAAMTKEGELYEIGDGISPTSSLPPPSPLALSPSAPPSSTPVALADLTGAEARDSLVYGLVSVGGSLGGTSINSWSQWEERAGLAVDASVHPPMVSLRHLVRSFSEAVLASGIGAVGLLGLNIPKWRPAGGGGGDGGSVDGGSDAATSAATDGVADRPRLLCGPWDVGSPSSSAAAHSRGSPRGRSNSVVMLHENAGSGFSECDDAAAAAEPLALTAIPQSGRREALSLTTVGDVETGSGAYVDSSRFRLTPDATGDYGNQGRHMCNYLHDGTSNARPNNDSSSSSSICDGGYGFDFQPLPPPAPMRARGPPLPPPEYDTFEAQWQVTEAEFGPEGQARDGPASRLGPIRALLSQW